MIVYITAKLTNPYLSALAKLLRDVGHEVHNPAEHSTPSVQEDVQYSEDRVVFDRNELEMAKAEAVVMLLPGGRGTHLEAGWCAQCKPVYIYDPGRGTKPELMYALCSGGYHTTEVSLLAAMDAQVRLKVKPTHIPTKGVPRS